MAQIVKAFIGSYFDSADGVLAAKIESYAHDHQLHIETLSYTVGSKYGYALVVFSDSKEKQS